MGRILLLQPFGDLGQARVARDERRRAGGGGLGGDHPERLGEDRRDDRRVREREQVDEVPVLERAGEERAAARRAARAPRGSRRSRRSRLGRRPRAAPRAGRGRPCCRGASRSRRRWAGRRRGTRRGARRSPRPAAARSRCPGFGGSRRASASRPASASSRGRGRHSSMSTPGRHLVDAVDVADDVLEHLADVRRADEDGLCALERFASPRGQQLRVAAHRVLELGAVGLDGVARAGRSRRPAHRGGRGCRRRGRPAAARATAAALRSTQSSQLGPRAVLHELDLVALVAVEHEDGQQPADVGPDGTRAAEVVPLGMRLLARGRRRRDRHALHSRASARV